MIITTRVSTFVEKCRIRKKVHFSIKRRKLGANAMKRVAAGTHLPTHWLFEPAKRSVEPTMPGLQFSPPVKALLVFTVQWRGARLVGEQW